MINRTYAQCIMQHISIASQIYNQNYNINALLNYIIYLNY